MAAVLHVALRADLVDFACSGVKPGSRPFASSPREILEISGSLKSLTGRAHEFPSSRFLREYARNLRGRRGGVPKCEVFGMGGCGQNAPPANRRGFVRTDAGAYLLSIRAAVLP